MSIGASVLAAAVPSPILPVVLLNTKLETPPKLPASLNCTNVSDPAGGFAHNPHVPSPCQQVLAFAPEPPFRWLTLRSPVTSVAKFTAPKVGAPTALPCRTVELVPKVPSVAVEVPPAPSMSWLATSVPPALTLPPPAGVPQVAPPEAESAAMKSPAPHEVPVYWLHTPPVTFGSAVHAEEFWPVPPRIAPRTPVTSLARSTAAKVGAPAALPWSTVVVVPSVPSRLMS